MSAPETTSKGRPSLLSETAPGVPDSSSRILASLEGRVSAQKPPRRRSNKKPLVAAALAVIVGAGALGAWQWQRSQTGGHPAVLAAAAGAGKPHAALAASAAATAAQAVQGAASTPQAAVIIADAPPASAASGVGADPLSRALASGVAAPAGKEASAAGGPAASGAKPVAKSAAAPARTEHENAKNRREKQAVAHAGPVKHPKGRGSTAHDDPDADLLAVLVARTKPYDAHAPAESSGAKATAAKARPVSLAAQVKQCDKSNFFEAQLCRWRVCSDHWGQDPACPSSSANGQPR